MKYLNNHIDDLIEQLKDIIILYAMTNLKDDEFLQSILNDLEFLNHKKDFERKKHMEDLMSERKINERT